MKRLKKKKTETISQSHKEKEGEDLNQKIRNEKEVAADYTEKQRTVKDCFE